MPHPSCFTFRLTTAVLAVTLLTIGSPACAQKPDELVSLRKELEALKAGQADLRKELDEIKALLKPAPQQVILEAPPGMTAPIADAPSRGSASAPVIMVEFSDYECPFCGRFVRDAYPSIDREFIQTGKVRHVFRAFPLESIHKNAFKAHEAAMCAGDQGKYWEMHDRLFANPKALALDDLVGHARAAGLEMTRFNTCLSSGTKTARVRQDVDAGAKMGVQGTPLFLIGKPGPNGDVMVLKGISGAQPFSVFKQAIEEVAAAK